MFPDPDYNVLGAEVRLSASSRDAPLPDYNEGLAASKKLKQGRGPGVIFRG